MEPCESPCGLRVAPGRRPGGPARAVCQNGRMAVTKTSFGRDPGLQSRMLLTLFLLGALYVVFAGALFAGRAPAA